MTRADIVVARLLRVLERPAAAAACWAGVALVLRLALLLASPDADGPHSPLFQGDAPYWLQQAGARDLSPAESLPLRPPAMRWVVAALWDGSADGLFALRLVLACCAASWAPLVLLALWRAGPVVAHTAAAWTAVNSAALQLAVTPSSEAVYGPLVAASLAVLPAIRHRPRIWAVAGFGAAQGVVCLLRAEHLLTVVALATWLVWPDLRVRAVGRSLATLGALVGGVFVATLPWNLEASRRVDAFVATPAPPVPRMLPWDADAEAELARLAPYLRGSARRFVEVTVAHRGGRRVAAADVPAVHREAFGVWPVPAPASPVFIALYGPLNFRLANGPETDTAGFSNAALTALPPLTGGADRFAPIWRDNLPRDGELNLEYPWHLRCLVHGYRDGLAWMAAHPGDALGRIAARLSIAWSGAAGGIGAAALPLGAAGERRAVDLTVATGPLAIAWRVVLAAVTLLGSFLGWRRAALQPWLLHAAALALVTAAFFGYARQGALWSPVVGAGLGVVAGALLRTPRSRRVALGIAAALLAALLVHDAVRAVRGVAYTVDARPVGVVEPWPPFEFRDRAVEVR